MIDIHTHILPGVDDGAEDFSDALLMAELAVEGGVHTIIATPHSNIPDGAGNFQTPELMERFRNLREKIKKRKLPLEILTGMEIYATDDVAEKIATGQFLSLNDTSYYLLEFGFYSSSGRITEQLEKVQKTGAIPVIAHPERYICVQETPDIVVDWLDMGCQLQMNKGSIFGNFGRASFRAAESLLRNECITYIASDAHSPYRRTTYMKDVYELIKEEFSLSMAERLLAENPEKYLRRNT